MFCQDSFESMIDFGTSHDLNSDDWEALYCKLQQSLDVIIEGLNPVVTTTGEDSRLEETLEDIKDTNSSTISAAIMPAISAATTAFKVTEQICGVATSFSSTEHSQSVFLSTTSAAEVAMIMDSDFVFPKLKMRDKHFDIVTRVKSTPATEALYLCSPLSPRCRAAKKYQKFQEPSCQNRSRHIFKFSKKVPTRSKFTTFGINISALLVTTSTTIITTTFYSKLQHSSFKSGTIPAFKILHG